MESLPALWLFFIRRKLPESPRWLEAVGQTEEANRVMLEIEKEVESRSGKPLPPIPVDIFLEKESTSSSFAELWSKDYYKRTIMLWILWPAALFGYYGLTTWFGSLLIAKGFTLIKSITFVITITAGGIPGFLLSTYLIERVGRKPVVILSLIMTAASAYLYGQGQNMTELYIYGTLLNFCQYAMWSAVYAYTPELYPTRIRATGCGLSSSVGRIGALLGPYVIGAILVSSGPSVVFNLVGEHSGC